MLQNALQINTLTEADIVAGKVANEATATSGDVPSDPGTTEDPTKDLNPALTVTKVTTSVNGNAITENTMVRPGDVIAYTITVTNSGNKTLKNVAVTYSLPVIYTGTTAGTTIENVTTMAPGTTKTYTVTYTVTQADITKGTNITNTAIATAEDGTTAQATTETTIPVNPDVTVNVTKQWDDENNQDGLRTNVTIQLMKGETAVEGKTLTLNGTTLTGYTSTVTGNMTDGFTVKNSHTPYKITISGQKTWHQDEIIDRPKEIEVQLLNGTTVVETKTVKASEDWKYSFTNKDRRANGTDIEYTIKEIGVLSIQILMEEIK